MENQPQWPSHRTPVLGCPRTSVCETKAGVCRVVSGHWRSSGVPCWCTIWGKRNPWWCGSPWILTRTLCLKYLGWDLKEPKAVVNYLDIPRNKSHWGHWYSARSYNAILRNFIFKKSKFENFWNSENNSGHMVDNRCNAFRERTLN